MKKKLTYEEETRVRRILFVSKEEREKFLVYISKIYSRSRLFVFTEDEELGLLIYESNFSIIRMMNHGAKRQGILKKKGKFSEPFNLFGTVKIIFPARAKWRQRINKDRAVNLLEQKGIKCFRLTRNLHVLISGQNRDIARVILEENDIKFKFFSK